MIIGNGVYRNKRAGRPALGTARRKWCSFRDYGAMIGALRSWAKPAVEYWNGVVMFELLL